MRIGVWNLKLAPVPGRARGERMLELMREWDADLWLLTEIDAAWSLPGYTAVTSGPRSGAPPQKRWAGIMCRDDVLLTQLARSDSTPADEGLCMARLVARDGNSPPLLVACSVLPWATTASAWPSLHATDGPDGYQNRFRYVTAVHLERIRRERQDEDVLVWGGDFNQSLTGRVLGTRSGREVLSSAFEDLGVVPLTAEAPHLGAMACSIDHVTVSLRWAASSAVTVVTRTDDARQDSDHALYLVDVVLTGSGSQEGAAGA
ncbi:MAG: hypothetical protein AVDCRST_MAG33-1815 [uncultured Thermomicrobiales bacterium]|uniref:Endonuclease/exonuclease/phosphatase domain-containing protein n=1 Tax=uncultured Thermomicrobiales bacterium TaxID=1645740 RepID=A0A6J4UZM2_9BACT|nr:MAG: hypothetical protein AVDCRST_MAG33-1815 [uncultured Thermomicrobiales bacterium]